MNQQKIKTESPQIQTNKIIAKKLAQIQAYEDDIPGVIIVINIKNSTVVYMSRRGREYLKVTNEELQEMGVEYHSRFFNPEESKEYAPEITGLLQRNNNDEIITFFQQVRPSVHENFRWYVSSVKLILWDNEGKPLLALTLAVPIDDRNSMAVRAQRLLAENNYLRQNYHLFELLTKRETEVLRFLAKGSSNEQIANTLYISEETVATHRKNIRRKLQLKNNYDFTRFALAFNLI